MNLQLSFLGAARNVTGSRHLVETDGFRFMVDCGLYQERHLGDRNWHPFPIPPAGVDAVILTHAHLDHCGFLPKLVKEGFRGPVYCTAATAEIAKIILLDCAKIQEEDAAHKRRRHRKEGREGEKEDKPLYDRDDAAACFELFAPRPYNTPVEIDEGVEIMLHGAGHVLGSSIVRATVRREGEERIILFSGDVGRPDRPIVRDAAVFDRADYVLLEATYGNRDHRDDVPVEDKICEVINRTRERGGKIIVPSFALERSQEILYYINALIMQGRTEPIRVFLDSPMASRITEVFSNHRELYDREMAAFARNHHSPFDMPGLEMAGPASASKAINDIDEPIIIIAGSGMCTGGRIKHHLVHNIHDPKHTIMFIGYQAQGTLGRRLVEGEKDVRILGRNHRVKSEVVRIHGFSAHADRSELLDWLRNIQTPPRRVFVVHGEEESVEALAETIGAETGWVAVGPEYGETIALE